MPMTETETKPARKTRLPGDPGTKERLAGMLRVDHAGEFGAARIYAGQLAVFGKRHPFSPVIRHMEAQEKRHLETFDRMINEKQVRPTALAPLWHGAGFMLGAATALMGEKAAMACTAAVEEVIEDHYTRQLDQIGDDDPALSQTIQDFRQEEIEHRETALDHGAEETPGYALLSRAIQTGCRLAIRLSEKI